MTSSTVAQERLVARTALGRVSVRETAARTSNLLLQLMRPVTEGRKVGYIFDAM